jgi:hypothetical protein
MNKVDAAVRLRLSPAQIAVLAPGISLLVQSHQAHQRKGTSPLAYPFRIYQPARGFDRGLYDQSFMDKVLDLWEVVKVESKSGRRVSVDTWHIRAGMFALRAYVDYVRLLRRQQRHEDSVVNARLHFDDRSIPLLKAKSHRVIRSLERHMKRANRVLIRAVGKNQFAMLATAWKAHLKWMRFHIVYCKPWTKPLPGRRARQQRDLDELMAIAKRGLIEEGYKAPPDKELLYRLRFRIWFDISCEDSNLEVPRVQCPARRRTHGPTFQLAIFSPGEIKVSTLAAGRLTVDQYESGVGLAVLPNDTDELPAVANSAILYR